MACTLYRLSLVSVHWYLVKNYISTMHTAQYNKNVLYNGMHTVQTANTLVVLVLVIRI